MTRPTSEATLPLGQFLLPLLIPAQPGHLD
jgi:hypothetical protein